MHRDRELWWLNPVWVSATMGIVLITAAYVVPDWMYRMYWRTPKLFDGAALRVTFACLAAFVVGAAAGCVRRGPAVHNDDWKERIPWNFAIRFFNVSFYLTILGYITWAAAAVSRGANLALVMGVLRGDKGASYAMKEVYLVTISGITTLTQFAIAIMVLGVLIGVAKGWRLVLPKFGILLIVTLFRALMNSERLALMELLVPAVVLVVRLMALGSPRFPARFFPLLRIAPVLGSVGLIGVFGASEYFRSWINYYAGGDLSFWQFVSLRLLGYYVTALNNGALLIQRIDPTGAPFFTLHLLWRFPILNSIADTLWPSLALTSDETDPYMRYLSVEANPEFNNGGGYLLPIIDFGFAGALLYWLLAGLACGVLYRMFQQKQLAGLLLYPITFTGIIELSRVIYWAEGRVFVPLVLLCAFIFCCTSYVRRHQSAERQLQWQPSP
ncbi:MAG TPA: hypothetical protein VKU01_25770 [Bryobacteraceae bacterium]|nr:hypothetical protein [Bryobacteraceae bacterium]